MDLVYASERHYNGGPPALESSTDKSAFKKTLFKASRRLQAVGIASNPLVIAGARVPIIKFDDRMTGIAVDISFENLSGVQAQATFDQWKREHPDMIYMVALVKQLLVMRGLNEVHTGGLGGFSIICLIVSYIQHSRKAENLGECFVGFLKYYGKEFDISRKRIQMNPPGVIEKVSFDIMPRITSNSHANFAQTAYGIDGRQEQTSGLSIQDPNKLDNNISGGSRRAIDAFKVFSATYDTLTDRMRASKSGASVGPSLLGSIIGGNYMSYIKQRRHLQTLK
jgi:non-canonical poly(A) RNA polymerase PAPD5/7